MVPAIASITSANEACAMERSYRSPSVLTRASGTLPLTVQIARWISSRNPASPVRLLRMTNVTRRGTLMGLPQKFSIRTGQ